MYTIREYRQKDLYNYTMCLYEGFFNCQIDNNDI
jgi:hypothetical protein